MTLMTFLNIRRRKKKEIQRLDSSTDPSNEEHLITKGNTKSQENQDIAEVECQSPDRASVTQPRPSTRVINNHPVKNIIRDQSAPMVTRRWFNNSMAYTCYLSQVELKNVKEALKEEVWIGSMQ